MKAIKLCLENFVSRTKLIWPTIVNWYRYWYENSTKDRTHRPCQKQFCHNIKVKGHMIPYTTKEKFLPDTSNKSALVSMISRKLKVSNIRSICCNDNADTIIMKESLQYSWLGNIGFAAKNAGIVIVLIHHFDNNIHKEIRILTFKGHYSVNEIVNNLTPDKKLWILFCHWFSGCNNVFSIFGVSKAKSYQKIYSGQLRQIISNFYCDITSIEDLLNTGILIFQFMYNMSTTSLSIQGSLCMQGLCRYNKQAKAGVFSAPLVCHQGMVLQYSILSGHIYRYRIRYF